MDAFTKLFGELLLFVYHCFDRIVIHGYLSGLSRPEQVVHFFRQIVGVAAVDKEVLSRRTCDYQNWVEAFARNRGLPIEWAEKGVRKEDHVLPWLRRMTKNNAYVVYFIFKSMEQGSTFRITVPKYQTRFERLRSGNSDPDGKMMIAARKGKGLSESDLEGLIEDMAELERLEREKGDG
jgi:hypothetical protein